MSSRVEQFKQQKGLTPNIPLSAPLGGTSSRVQQFLAEKQSLPINSSLPVKEEKPGFFKGLVQEVAKPFIQISKGASSLSPAIKSKFEKDPIKKKQLEEEAFRRAYQPTDAGYFGKVEASDYSTKDALGKGFEIGSYMVGTGLAKKAVKTGLKTTFKQGLKIGAKENLIPGLTGGFGAGLQDKDATFGSVALSTGLGGLTGAGIGGVAGGVGGYLGKFKVDRIIKDTSKKIDDIAGKIVQGNKNDIAKAGRALSQIDISGVETADQLAEALSTRESVIAKKLDETLDTEKLVRPLKNLDYNNHNFVNDAFEQLDELYSKTNDPEKLAELRALRNKAESSGLTVREINDLARMHGNEFAEKAFSKRTGDALTSVNAQTVENTRKGLKNTAKSIFKNPIFDIADKELSDIINTKRLIKKLAEDANTLRQKFADRGLLESIGRNLFNAIDTLSGRGISGFLRAAMPRGYGTKLMQATDLEKVLQKNLQILQKANTVLEKKTGKITPDVVREMEDIIKSANLRPALLSLPPGKTTLYTPNIPSSSIDPNIVPPIEGQAPDTIIGVPPSGPLPDKPFISPTFRGQPVKGMPVQDITERKVIKKSLVPMNDILPPKADIKPFSAGDAKNMAISSSKIGPGGVKTTKGLQSATTIKKVTKLTKNNSNAKLGIKSIDDLTIEARKYKNAEEFVKKAEFDVPTKSLLPTDGHTPEVMKGKLPAKGYENQPIRVEINKEGKLQIQDGNRRWYQALERGDKTVRIVFNDQAPALNFEGEFDRLTDIWNKANKTKPGIKSTLGQVKQGLKESVPGLYTNSKYTIEYKDKSGKTKILKDLDRVDASGWTKWLEENGIKWVIKTVATGSTAAAIASNLNNLKKI